MRVSVRVVPRAGRNSVLAAGGSLKVYLRKPAADGLANAQLVKVLAEYYQVKKYDIRIASGEKSRNKIIEVNCPP